jgi:hypothetical protein
MRPVTLHVRKPGGESYADYRCDDLDLAVAAVDTANRLVGEGHIVVALFERKPPAVVSFLDANKDSPAGYYASPIPHIEENMMYLGKDASEAAMTLRQLA